MPLRVHGAETPFSGVVTTEIFSTVPSVPQGLGKYLKWVPSVYANPQTSFITAVDSVAGNPPTTLCDQCQTAGSWKTCTQIIPYGTLCYASPSITPHQELLRLNQGEPDYTLVNPESLVTPEVREMIGTGEGLTAEALLQHAVAMGMVAVARQLLLTMGVWLWSGDPAGGTEGHMPFIGLDSQIKTGIVDAITNDPCPSMDSIVVAYNDTWNATDQGGSKLANLLSTVMAALEERAVPFGGAEFAIVVPPALKYYLAMAFYGMVNVSGWGMTFPTGMQGVIDLTELNARREGALARDEIVINGITYKFIADQGIPVTVNQNLRVGNIYVVPLSAGGRPATYWNYLDYRRAPQLNVNPMVITDRGRAMWWATQSGACITVSARCTPRVVLLTPRLAAKITSVTWPAIQTGIGEPYPDGGRSYP